MKNFKANLQIVALFLAIGAVSAEWNYCNQGYWDHYYETCGKGTQQSPIALNDKDAPLISLLAGLKFVNYNTAVPVVVENNGQTVNIQLPTSPNSPYITGGALPKDSPFASAEFEAASSHFHWGSSDGHGSEHVLNGKKSSAEVHIVHFNRKYLTFDNAVQYSDGISVIGILINVGKENPGFNKVINAVKDIRRSGESTVIKNFVLGDFISGLKNYAFMTYPGSLTTPGCNEVVTWHVMRSVVEMSPSQIEVFRGLTGKRGASMNNNYRGLQPLNNRSVQIYGRLL